MLTPREYSALKWAVGEAETWRGSMIGNPDTSALDEFERRLNLAKIALKKLSDARKKTNG